MKTDFFEAATTTPTPDPNSHARDYRDQLRVVAKYEEMGDNYAAASATSRADMLWKTLEESIAKLLYKHAVAQFGSQDNPEFFDFINELRSALYLQLSNLSESQDIWQRKFNLCLKRLVIKVALRVKREYGILGEDSPAANGIILQSLNDPVGKNESGQEQKLGDFVSAPDSEMGVALAEANAVLEWIGRKLSPKHLQVVQLKWSTDWTWEEIGAHCGICEKTARTYCTKAEELFRKSE